MKIRRYYGKDMREALNKVKEELGGDAVIMSNKKVADGVEIVVAYENEPDPKPILEKAHAKLNAAQNKPNSGAFKVSKTPSLSEIIGDSGPDSLRALLEKQANGEEIAEQKHETQPEPQRQQAPVAPTRAAPANNGQAKSHILHDGAATSDSAAIKAIQSELKSLRSVLQFQVSGLMKQEQQRSHPLHAYLTSRLEAMGVCPELAEDVVSYAPEDASERDAWLYILKLLANRLRTTNNDILTQTGVVAFMGPTGTGKTTTIAKLAAQYARKYGPDQVALVTIDSYRIAAFEQLATYGKIIGCTVKKASNGSELSDVLYQLRNKRLVLIDTAGFSQRDSRLIKQLDTLKETSCANIRMYMVLQANTQRQTMERTLAVYKNMAIQGCIFTKLDECYSLGESISVAIQHRMPVAYLTDGQKVPEDIKIADAKYLISLAAKLYKKYELPHTSRKNNKYPALAV
ncbi:MAG: flagellar biosynthesis protein FlhF [Aestuariibacter sp.]